MSELKSRQVWWKASGGLIYWAELVLLAGLYEQLDLCMQSWPVPVICWSSSSISLTRKEFSLLILLFSRIERLLLRAHITNSFLIYLLFINNLSLLAIHCCFSLPRHAFIIEFDLLGHHWKYLRKIKGSFFAQWIGWKGKNSLKQHMDFVWSGGLWAVTGPTRHHFGLMDMEGRGEPGTAAVGDGQVSTAWWRGG